MVRVASLRSASFLRNTEVIVPVDKCELRPVEMDFRSSEQGMYSTSAIWFGEVCLANSIDLVQFDEDPTQVIVCDKCGITGCAAGGWVQQRRIGGDVIWIPCVPEKNAWLCETAGPPAYMTAKPGIVPLFRPALYDDLRRRTSTLPDRNEIPPIRVGEMLRLVQAVASVEVLGRFGETPALRRELILAVRDRDVIEELDLVAGFIDRNLSENAAMVPVAPGEGFQVIEFYLDAPQFPAWRSFCHIGEGLGIALDATGPLKIVNETVLTA